MNQKNINKESRGLITGERRLKVERTVTLSNYHYVAVSYYPTFFSEINNIKNIEKRTV